ncbi:CBS domain protein [Halohasta litchfieldiae]|jgi:CBS domain-containing protein|uniref:CBS domain-containing protein n=1 Tax=Halohasta litchfieldiae TaxID=1073996 RepID=A0A1H6SQ97_9EURY|nr:CBS domain-containing protein [Halohasta litchfieldiae]ATW86902.1 CBS domain protein [Halohasta litchfieldiae]SEI70013.1 CBS domain-containing protein [Halohasta litchfieldiae]
MRNGITVRDVMNREFVGVSESDRLDEAAELMTAETAEAVVVLRGPEPIGSVSTATALAAMLEGDPHEQSVGEVMEPPVSTVAPDTALSDATQQLVSRSTTHLLVVDDDEVVGLLTEHDVLAATETVEASAVATSTTAGDTGEATETIESEAATEQSVQGICEGCGSLTPELATMNGQLVCPACRAY